MKKELIITVIEGINRFKAGMGGVFGYSDLSNIMGTYSTVTNSRAIQKLVKAKILTRIQRGFYVTRPFDLFTLSQRLAPDSYISMDSALAQRGFIGTIPKERLSVVWMKPRAKKIKTPNGDIIYCSLSADLFFGFEMQGAIAMATPEKAFIDMLYFYTKGRRFVIDPLTEVDVSRLNKKSVNAYLKKYKNPKFVKFARRILNA
ncbi:MAG: hypothetical protein Q7T03_03980 [Deltaproteobacteria bacterium]|nr:hypothetical protein [Deltaproteobacteria bacterium]